MCSPLHDVQADPRSQIPQNGDETPWTKAAGDHKHIGQRYNSEKEKMHRVSGVGHFFSPGVWQNRYNGSYSIQYSLYVSPTNVETLHIEGTPMGYIW